MKAHVRSRSETLRRRGTALVMVLLLSIGALALVSTLIGLSQNMAKTERHRRSLKSLQEVVNAGISMAVNEINRRRLEGTSYADPTGNGYGAILFPPGTSSGSQNWATMGVPIRDIDGRIIGRLRADVYPRGAPTGGTGTVGDSTKILRVVVASPGFDTDAKFRTLASAELEIKRGNPPFDRNALSIRGDADAGGKPGLHGGGNQVSITGLDPNFKVPAINISDTSTYNAFVAGIDAFDGSGDNISGSNADGTGVAYMEDTVTNEDQGLLNQQTVQDIADGIDARVTNVLTTGTQITSTQLNNSGTTNLGTGKFYLNQTAELKGTITGSGTLVITKAITVKGELNWNGDIIIANESGAGLDVVSGGKFLVADKTPNTTSDGGGVFCIQGIGDTNDQLGLKVKGDCFIGDKTNNYPGAMTIIGNSTTNSTVIDILSGSELKVYGIFTIMGNNINIDFSSGGKLTVDGSMALITPAGGTGIDIDIGNSFHLDLNFNAVGFDNSLNALGQFFDPEGTKLPVSTGAYWETVPSTTFAQQNTRVFGVGDNQVFSALPTFDLLNPGSNNFGY